MFLDWSILNRKMKQSAADIYDDIRKKLIAKGVPDEEIAFIHDANTDIKKAKLFAM